MKELPGKQALEHLPDKSFCAHTCIFAALKPSYEPGCQLLCSVSERCCKCHLIAFD